LRRLLALAGNPDAERGYVVVSHEAVDPTRPDG